MTVREIAKLIAGEVQGDAARDIRGLAALDTAGPDDLAYAEDAAALKRAADSKAGCILLPTGPPPGLPSKTTIAVRHPKLAFVRAAESLLALAPPEPGRHATALIAPDASVSVEASVGPYVVIESGARVGPRTRLASGVALGEGAEVGSDCVLYPRVTVYPGARIGNRVILHAGVVIGSDGFGYVLDEGRHHKFPQLGQVIIEDDVEIGSNSTVDRGSLGATVIGQGTKIDNLCQVAHNVRIGRHTIIAGQSGAAGSAEIGSYVVLGGQVGVSDHCRLEDRVMVGAKSAVFPGKVVFEGAVVAGIPARPVADFKRQQASLARLPGLARQLRELVRGRTAP